MNELALFAGAGGGILGGHLLGWRTICAVERDAYAASVLAQRQNDGCFQPFPIWSDITSFDGRPWAGRVDVVSGGFPCQDISPAGKGAGISGARSSLWGEMARIVREVRPRYVFVENSAMLTSRGLGRVLGDLAELGFDARWGVLRARDVGAEHGRERIWIVADALRFPSGERAGWERVLDVRAPVGCFPPKPSDLAWDQYSGGSLPQPVFRRGADGMAGRADRLKAIGNGQVPRVAAAAFSILAARADESGGLT